MPIPDVPLMTDDVAVNQRLIVEYLINLISFLRQGEPDPAWSVTGTIENKTMVSGLTLTSTQDVLGTVIRTLQSKGIL